MNVRAISFDAAGTLIRVDWDPGAIAVSAAKSVGITVPDEPAARETYLRLLQSRRSEFCQINRHRSRARNDQFWRELGADWLERVGLIGDPDALFEAGDQHTYNKDQTVFRLYEDSRPILEALKTRGFRLILLSNWDVSLHRTCEYLEIAPFFDAIIASLEEGIEKPDPELFRVAEKAVGLSPDEILHVGDDPLADIEGARRASWKSVLIDRGADPLLPHRISSLDQLVHILD